MKPVPGRNPCVISWCSAADRLLTWCQMNCGVQVPFRRNSWLPCRFQVGWKKGTVRRRSSCTPFKWDTWPCPWRRFFCCTVSCTGYRSWTFQYSYQRTRSGGYEDDLDLGYELWVYLFNAFNPPLTFYSSTYTGQGGLFYQLYQSNFAQMEFIGGQGKRVQGIKWDNVQNADQEWTRGNLALAVRGQNFLRFTTSCLDVFLPRGFRCPVEPNGQCG